MRPLLQSFFIAGFEASTMRRRDGRRNDLVAATRHDELAVEDFARVQSVGITTVREGAAWHRLQPRPGIFDPRPVLSRVRAAEAAGIQVIWDLCHFGWPDDVDPFATDFAKRFAEYAGRFAGFLRDETTRVPWFVPINEPSFVAWAGGDVGYLNPFAQGRGDALKRQLIRAELAAAAAIRAVDPRARICHVDPVIHIVPSEADPDSRTRVAAHNEAQFAAWDMLGGTLHDELGGSEAELDVIGVNFYDRNEWVDGGRMLQPGDAGYRPLRLLLADVHRRYRRPIIVAETGTEGDARGPWLAFVADEVAAARADGVPVEGICLYPAVEHPGWDDDRHVPVGLWGYPGPDGHRPPHQPVIDELRRQTARLGARAADDELWISEPVRPRPRTRRPVICLVTDSRDPSGLGRMMTTLAHGLAADSDVVVAAPEAIDAAWLLRDAAGAGLETWVLPDASPMAQAAELQARLTDRRIDVVNVHAGIGWEGHEAARAAKAAGAVVVRTEHLPYLLTKLRDRSAYWAGIESVDLMITVSAGVAATHVAAGLEPARVRIVRNGIEAPTATVDRRGVLRALGIPHDAQVVCSVGRLTPQKGYDVLLRAAADVGTEVPGTWFVIVGSGRLADELEALRGRLDLATVTFVERMTDVPSLVAAADVVALPSRFEGLPLVALEAMSLGRPIVASRVTGIDEVVTDRSTGRLVPAEDAPALAHAIVDVLEQPALARAYGEAGRRRYAAEFGAARMVDETRAVFAELLGQRVAAGRAGTTAAVVGGAATWRNAR